ncbi:hypothetical protein MLD38_024622 [Melastoma candidum]|uniref:Uncharacterized protein n=1 Tax=Melastoma candidum TaxID=119954 RepID=A0ACB9NTU4_9MYRT|nr:hypothetical protein MLD38_024622 [Melastoma candidum]
MKDVAHQDQLVRLLTNSLQTSNCPHMLFYGPPGTGKGKTTTALAVARQLYGSRVLELNASDYRGINVVLTKIKDFAAVAVGSSQRQGYLCPPFEIIILDEVDSMTEDAQSLDFSSYVAVLAVRKSGEGQMGTLINSINKPLTPRCAKFRFKPLPEEVMSSRIQHICNEEGLNFISLKENQCGS